MNKKLNCFIVDDHPMMRQGLKSVLTENLADVCHVCGEAGSVEEAVRELKDLAVDVLILDHTLRNETGFELVSKLVQSHPQIQILIITQNEDAGILHNYRDLGVKGILSKISTNEDLVKCIQAIRKGETFFSENIQAILDQPVAESALTPREIEVVRLVAVGKTNKEVAALLECSVETIKTHKSNILEKLNISNSVELTVWAMKQGLV
jgi:DNA-binding NarL/FixJ family response regulator